MMSASVKKQTLVDTDLLGWGIHSPEAFVEDVNYRPYLPVTVRLGPRIHVVRKVQMSFDPVKLVTRHDHTGQFDASVKRILSPVVMERWQVVVSHKNAESNILLHIAHIQIFPFPAVGRSDLLDGVTVCFCYHE